MEGVYLENIESPLKSKSWRYFFALLVNLVFFTMICFVYISYTKNVRKNIFDENIKSVANLNIASANVAYSYTIDMNHKLNDIVSYIKENQLNTIETFKFLKEINTNPNRQLQIVLSGNYTVTGELSFGDYSGLSIRCIANKDGTTATVVKNIIYSRGYYDILRSFTDVKDSNDTSNCFVTEFTDPDTKLKSFAVYRHISIIDTDGKKKLYTILLVVNSEKALKSYNLQNKYKEQSTVLISKDGTYIVKNHEFRNTNFYDYIINYNSLTLDWKLQLQNLVYDETHSDRKVVNLFYKNHKGVDCLFSISGLENGWYSITCVPLASFNLQKNATNYSLIILLLFIVLFVVDGIMVLYFVKVMSERTKIAIQAQKNADKANLAKSRFLSTMSHELRTPLNAIIGFVNLSEGTLDKPVQLKDYLSKINISSKLLLQLISDILDISAIESNKMKITSSEFNLNDMVTSLSAIFYDQCAKKNIEFSVLLKDIHSEILIGDAVRVNQVLLNFLSNSVKFTPSGGNVTFKVEQTNRTNEVTTIRFSITDTGCGISEEQKNRLFKPFERALGDKAVKYGGSGLGLSIAKNITELMHGSVGVESVEGMGSTFWSEIPFKISESYKNKNYSPIKGLKIVAAINNEDEREYFGQILANLGLVYDLVSNAKSVFELLNKKAEEKEPYNLCILDWKLSDLNALDATKEIRKRFSEEDVRIVILAYDLVSSRPVCSKDGPTYIVGKPVFSSSLYNFFQEIVTNKVKTVKDNNTKYDLKQKRVLLIEDNALNIEIAESMLLNFNAKVETVVNGKEGFEKFVASKPGYFDVILMDIQMPIMNGYEASVAIRESLHPEAKTIPILAMTADAFSEDVERAKEAGMNEHIAKPIEPERLYNVLKSVLNLE